MRKPIEFTTFPKILAAKAPYGPYRAIIKYDVDGDTVYGLCDPGFNDYPFKEFRLARINAPERFSGTAEERAKGDTSWEYLKTIIPEGTPVLMYTKPDPDKYLRYIADILLADGRMVSDIMVIAGMAEYHTY
jgi:endonuclease YncB( thermonuclease family)